MLEKPLSSRETFDCGELGAGRGDGSLNCPERRLIAERKDRVLRKQSEGDRVLAGFCCAERC